LLVDHVRLRAECNQHQTHLVGAACVEGDAGILPVQGRGPSIGAARCPWCRSDGPGVVVISVRGCEGSGFTRHDRVGRPGEVVRFCYDHVVHSRGSGGALRVGHRVSHGVRAGCGIGRDGPLTDCLFGVNRAGLRAVAVAVIDCATEVLVVLLIVEERGMDLPERVAGDRRFGHELKRVETGPHVRHGYHLVVVNGLRIGDGAPYGQAYQVVTALPQLDIVGSVISPGLIARFKSRAGATPPEQGEVSLRGGRCERHRSAALLGRSGIPGKVVLGLGASRCRQQSQQHDDYRRDIGQPFHFFLLFSVCELPVALRSVTAGIAAAVRTCPESCSRAIFRSRRCSGGHRRLRSVFAGLDVRLR